MLTKKKEEKTNKSKYETRKEGREIEGKERKIINMRNANFILFD
jgi:hypothetical protein